MKHNRERFLSACRAGADYVVTDGDEMTVYTAVERPLHEEGARIFAAWASANGVSIIEVRSNLLRLRLGSVVSDSQVLEQLGACRSLPLAEGMAEVVDRSGLWDDLPAEAGAFIEIRGESCDAFSHLRVPIRGVPKSQFRWVE